MATNIANNVLADSSLYDSTEEKIYISISIMSKETE